MEISWELASRLSGGSAGESSSNEPSGASTWKLTAPGGVASLVNDTVAGAALTLPARSSAATENVHVPSWSTLRVEKSALPPALRASTVWRSFSTVVFPSLKDHV